MPPGSSPSNELDATFRALADPSRRRLLDRLNERNGQSLSELCSGLGMTRQAVTKHLAVLEEAQLVTTRRRGREKLHYLNAAPIAAIGERWIGAYQRQAQALAGLKRVLEDKSMSRTEFVYVTYIETTPETLWRALTEPQFTRRYWGAELKSDWKPGSPLLWREGGEGEFEDLDQVILESDPPRLLSYTWHRFQPWHAEMFGWSQEKLATVLQEKQSKVTFEIEPAARDMVKLSVRHDGFDEDSEMLKAISGGWPAVLSSLKTLLETGDPLPERANAHASEEALKS